MCVKASVTNNNLPNIYRAVKIYLNIIMPAETGKRFMLFVDKVHL